MAAPTSSAQRFRRTSEDRSIATFRQRLRARDWMVGTVISSADPVLAERISASFDFVWIDLEHSAISVRDVQMLLIVAQGAGAHALVRVPSVDAEGLQAILDCGPDGVVAPKVGTAEAVDKLVRSLEFPPDGNRGFAPRRASGARSGSDLPTRRSVAAVIQIETREALERIDDLVGHEGLDGVVVGTADLSLDLGDPLNIESPELASAARRVGESAGRRGVAWGLAAGALPDWVVQCAHEGCSSLVFSSDARIYTQAIDDCAKTLDHICRSVMTEPEGGS